MLPVASADILPSRMTAISGVLESSRQALSIGRIDSLIGANHLENSLGQKGGQKADGSFKSSQELRFAKQRSKMDQMMNCIPLESSLQSASISGINSTRQSTICINTALPAASRNSDF
eukprot:scaffold15438_cov85-Skeletonema_dohrnii-CCMP3373.AAC.3